MENCTAYVMSNLQLHFIYRYIYLLLTLKEIFQAQPSVIYFIEYLNCNRSNIWLKTIVGLNKCLYLTVCSSF